MFARRITGTVYWMLFAHLWMYIHYACVCMICFCVYVSWMLLIYSLCRKVKTLMVRVTDFSRWRFRVGSSLWCTRCTWMCVYKWIVYFIFGLSDLRKISNCDFSDQYCNCDLNCDYFLLIKPQACICSLHSIEQDMFVVYQALSKMYLIYKWKESDKIMLLLEVFPPLFLTSQSEESRPLQ